MEISLITSKHTANRSISKTGNFRTSKYANLAPLKKDTISFSAKISKDLMSLSPEKIVAECRKALKDGIKLGEGQEAITYKIENYPAYCLRRDKRHAGSPQKFKFDIYLNKYDKANHVVAKLDEGTQLMEYINGIPLKVIPGKDTPDGIIVKNASKGLVANNFSEKPFRKVIEQIEDAKNKGITFDRKGENLHVDVLNQEITAFDFSPSFNDIEYNPIAYIYSALDVDGTEYAAKIFGKLCKAYANRILQVPPSKLNLDTLDTNFYHRGFMDDAFNLFPDRKILKETQERIENLIKEKLDTTNPKEYMEYLVNDFNEFVDEKVMTIKGKSPFSTLSTYFD